jgi:ABC-type dipeptide/oligopeptide/nickel transport system ATPase component
LARVHLAEPEKIVSRYSFELSGGQLQRCAIALTMAAEPRLLIADEPTTALDVITQNKIISLLKEIYGRFGTSILFISHDLALVKRLAQRVAVMQAGEVVETGPVEKIFLNPEKNYTRQLVESIPVLRRF